MELSFSLLEDITKRFGMEQAYEHEKELVRRNKWKELLKRKGIDRYDKQDFKILAVLFAEHYGIGDQSTGIILQKYQTAYIESFNTIFLRTMPTLPTLLIRDFGVHAAISEMLSHELANLFRHAPIQGYFNALEDY